MLWLKQISSGFISHNNDNNRHNNNQIIAKDFDAPQLPKIIIFESRK